MKKKIKIGDEDALVIVDCQNDFVSPDGKLFVSGMPGESSMSQLLMYIKKLAELPFHYIFTTEDSHPEDHVEFALHGEHCVEGTAGKLFHGSLAEVYRQANMRLVKGDNKYVMSYSASTSSQFLRQIVIMRTAEIKRVFVVGLAYNFCVGQSAIDYARHGFETYVVRDATRSVPAGPQNMQRLLEDHGVQEVFVREVLYH